MASTNLPQNLARSIVGAAQCSQTRLDSFFPICTIRGKVPDVRKSRPLASRISGGGPWAANLSNSWGISDWRMKLGLAPVSEMASLRMRRNQSSPMNYKLCNFAFAITHTTSGYFGDFAGRHGRHSSVKRCTLVPFGYCAACRERMVTGEWGLMAPFENWGKVLSDALPVEGSPTPRFLK